MWGGGARGPYLAHGLYVARGKFEVAQPIRCRLRAYLLLIRYVTL